MHIARNAYHSFSRLLNILPVNGYLAENGESVLRSDLVMLLIYPQQAEQNQISSLYLHSHRDYSNTR
jgi:hypothetical protein